MTSPQEASIRDLSVRTYLFILVLSVFLPAVGIFAWHVSHEQEAARKDAYARVKSIAIETAANLRGILDNNEAVLKRLAERPLVRALNAKHCDPILRDYVSLHPEFGTLAMRDSRANLICTLISITPSAENVRQLAWFQEGMSSGQFTVSGASLRPGTSRWVFVSAYPIRNNRENVSGLVFFAIDLLKLDQEIFRAAPENAVVAVIDRQNKFLLRSIDPEKWIGQSVPAEIATKVQGPPESYFFQQDVDHVRRQYAFVTVPGTGWRVFAGLPVDDVLAGAQQRFIRSLVIGFGLLVLILALAWWMSSAISKPIRALASTSGAIAAGNAAARAFVAGPIEVKYVAQQFNHMLEAHAQQEEELKKSRERLQRAQKLAHIGDWEWDAQTGELHWEEENYRIFGLPPETVPSLQTFLGSVHPDDLAFVKQSMTDALEGQRPYDLDMRIRRSDGTERVIHAYGEVDRDAAGKPIRFFGTIQDITEQRRLEELHLQAQKLESLGTLAGGIAHDFNNILAAIRGNADLAAEDVGPDHVAAESLEEIKKASTRAHELVRRIMVFGRPKEIQKAMVDLGAVVGEVLKLLRSTIPTSIALNTTFIPDTPQLFADEGQIHEAIVNLTTNAVHAIGAHTGTIEYRLEPVQVDGKLAQDIPGLKSGRYVRLTVKDSGCGMDAGTMARIFDAFYTTKAAGEGTGLGLSMVHGTMKSHDGAVTVESTPGEGSNFHLYFPVAK